MLRSSPHPTICMHTLGLIYLCLTLEVLCFVGFNLVKANHKHMRYPSLRRHCAGTSAKKAMPNL